MRWPLLFLLTVTASPESPAIPVSYPAAVEVQGLSEEVGDAHKGLKGLKNDMLCLELYLQDRKDHKEFCPEIEWEQPSMEVYKKDPRSHLPEDCKEKQ